MTPPRYVSATELAARYGVSERTIWRWATSGTLPAPRWHAGPGGATRWDVQEILALEAKRTGQPSVEW